MKKLAIIIFFLAPIISMSAENLSNDILIEKMSKDKDVIELFKQTSFLYALSSVATTTGENDRKILKGLNDLINKTKEKVASKFPEYAGKNKNQKKIIMKEVYRAGRFWRFVRCILRDVTAGLVSAGAIYLYQQRCIKRCMTVVIAGDGIVELASEGTNTAALPDELTIEIRGCVKFCNGVAGALDFITVLGIIGDVLADCAGLDNVKDLIDEYTNNNN